MLAVFLEAMSDVPPQTEVPGQDISSDAEPVVETADDECLEPAPIDVAAFEAEFKRMLKDNYVPPVAEEMIPVEDVLCSTCCSFFADVAYFPCGHVRMFLISVMYALRCRRLRTLPNPAGGTRDAQERRSPGFVLH